MLTAQIFENNRENIWWSREKCVSLQRQRERGNRDDSGGRVKDEAENQVEAKPEPETDS